MKFQAARSSRLQRPGQVSPAPKFHFAFDLDRNVEWQLRKTDRAACVRPDFRAEDIHNEVRETVDHNWLPFESGRGVDHAEYAGPGGNPIKIAELALQASEYGQTREARRLIGLLFGDFQADLAERRGK